MMMARWPSKQTSKSANGERGQAILELLPSCH